MRICLFNKTIVVVALLLSACSANTTVENTLIPNPADKKCIDDGYSLQQVTKGGVPVGSECISAKSGAKCESWAYFRGECLLK